jgi:hypothetical protein
MAAPRRNSATALNTMLATDGRLSRDHPLGEHARVVGGDALRLVDQREMTPGLLHARSLVPTPSSRDLPPAPFDRPPQVT